MSDEPRDLLLLAAAIAAASGIVVLAMVVWFWRRPGMKLESGRRLRVVASDTGVLPPMFLLDPVLGLGGRPDYLVEDVVDGRNRLIPIEVKPTRRSLQLYESDAAQVGAYLMVSRAAFGERAADFGYAKYANRSFRVRLTIALERRVLDIVAGIRLGRRTPWVHRSHAVPARCARCAMRDRCNESLV
jgi:CRISPR/Cas system-associated exonuclease Cas4 (RecB family)